MTLRELLEVLHETQRVRIYSDFEGQPRYVREGATVAMRIKRDRRCRGLLDAIVDRVYPGACTSLYGDYLAVVLRYEYGG